MACDSSGYLYVTYFIASSNPNTGLISKVTPAGAVSSIIVSGLQDPESLALDSNGNVYVTNQGAILKVTPAGAVSTFVSGLDPEGMAFDATGNLYVSNNANNTISKVTPSPVVGSVSPFLGPVSGSTSVTITGTGLTAATAVKFGGTAATITSDTATQIVATSPPGTGVVDVTVTTAGGTSATSPADEFNYGPVAVTGVSPLSGPVTGGTSVTITGAGLAPPRRWNSAARWRRLPATRPRRS